MKMFKVLSKVFNPPKETKASEMTLNNASYIGFDLETVRLAYPQSGSLMTSLPLMSVFHAHHWPTASTMSKCGKGH